MGSLSVAKFHHLEDGESYYEDQGINYEECCDCGLVHRVRYEVHDSNGKRIKGARVHLTAWRAPHVTKTRRRLRKKSIVVL